MFDLFRSRAKAVRYMLGALLLLVAVSMVVTLIPGYGTPTFDERVIAEIDKEPITALQVQRRMASEMRSRQIPQNVMELLAPEFVNQMITEAAVAYEAKRMGFQITDEELAKVIRSLLPQLFQDGQLASKDMYAQFLAEQNLTIPEFEDSVRKQVLLSRLQNVALEGLIATPGEVEAEFRRRNEKIKLDYIALSAERFQPQVTVSPEEVQAYYNAHKAELRLPEKRAFDLVIIDQKMVESTFEITEEQLRQAYNEEKDRFRTPERVKVRHILLKTTEKPADEIPKIEAKANDLLKQIKGGADFAELAKKHSEDVGSAVNGGDLDWVTRGQTVKNFEDTAFSLKANEISGVIKTEYGYHILQVMAREEAKLRPFEEVRAELATGLKTQLVYDRMQGNADQARAALVQNPQGAEQVAQKLNAQFVRVDRAAANEQIPEAANIPEVRETIAGLGNNEVTPVIQAGANRLAVAVVREVIPARQAELAEVEKDIRTRLSADKAKKMSEDKTQEAVQLVKNAGGDLQRVAKALGLEVKSTDEFSLDGAAEGLGPAAPLHAAFSTPVGSIAGPISLSDQMIFAKVTKKVPADMSKLAAQREELIVQVKGQKARMRKELFEDGILNKLVKEGKVKIHREAVDRLVASYRG